MDGQYSERLIRTSANGTQSVFAVDVNGGTARIILVEDETYGWEGHPILGLIRHSPQ